MLNRLNEWYSSWEVSDYKVFVGNVKIIGRKSRKLKLSASNPEKVEEILVFYNFYKEANEESPKK